MKLIINVNTGQWKCPKCGSFETKMYGSLRENECWRCKDCDTRFIIEPKEQLQRRQIKREILEGAKQ